MESSLKLAAFQRAAVDHIVARLSDASGSRRFLLADEVGLGKTVVAQGVIERLSKRRRKGRFTVVYLCSNTEISEQNRKKLVRGGGEDVRRVTELAIRRSGGPRRSVRLYSFTPNTSLEPSTGLARERRLLLFLFGTMPEVGAHSDKFREFFRGGVRSERWAEDTARARLKAEFSGVSARIRREFVRAMRGKERALFDKLVAHVKDGQDRHPVIRACRSVLQRLCLLELKADLIVLDEIQRFRHIIDNVAGRPHLASALLGAKTPTLILSATPYRMLSLASDAPGANHHAEFLKTLKFLCSTDSETPANVEKDLDEFGRRLRSVELGTSRDNTLLALKRRIEGSLRNVMCRTERNWYLDERADGASEAGEQCETLPNALELREFVALERNLRPHADVAGQITDYWKSCPSVLTFTDRGYALHRRLVAGTGKGKRRAALPEMLLSSPRNEDLCQRNQRMQLLLKHTLGEDGSPPLLWTAPSLRYLATDAFGDAAPRKVLVFSGWRFVPKAIAVVASQATERRLSRGGAASNQPLQLKAELSSHVFDVCLPSLALATIVDPLAIALAHGSPPTEEQLVDLAQSALRTRLSEVGVEVSKAGSMLPWQAAMLLESRLGFEPAVRDALLEWWAADGVDTRPVRQNARRLGDWLDETSKSTISPDRLRRLALIAVGSPAVALLRSGIRLFSATACAKALPRLWTVGFEALRSYFNRPTVQQTVRFASGTKRRKRAGRQQATGYSVQVLRYCLKYEFQAVMDEHTFLAKADGGADSVDALATHLERIWSLEPGLRRTNAPRRRGNEVIISSEGERFQTHFALAFGDELKSESATGSGSKPLRRTEIREAFNSPFWPFVLATTSVGQEGLDFHWHCRDVFHWNLPANPVDLEQREGRVNRRHGLAVRQSIARDWSLRSLEGRVGERNPWDALFNVLEGDQQLQRYKQGLYPHWIYECKDPAQTVGVVRHVSHFRASRDAERYQVLKERLALYRLVFGQAKQEHLLSDLHDKLRALPDAQQREARRSLRGYMLNLSPISRDEAMKFAREEAEQLLATPSALCELLTAVRQILDERPEPLASVRGRITRMVRLIDGHINGRRVNRPLLVSVVTALAYLRNPYDQYFDTQAVGGWDDDVAVIRGVAIAT